mmetsp:Transcript_29432/g.44559  ORF Transcript_29432/g.44559 Transcript_29432/m.44559 type:complete len:115 (+) Transcript_29432:1248-1592(+)
MANPQLENQILDMYMKVDSSIDQCERVLGSWNPSNRFLNMYQHLDEICDKIDSLDTSTMNSIGNLAKDLNKDLEEILKNMQIMKEVNYDKSKIDFLFMMVEKAIECEEHVRIIS